MMHTLEHKHVVLAIATMLLAAGCRDIRDLQPKDDGRPRVISLHDVTTEIIATLRATDHLVGVAELVDATPDTQRVVAHVPRVASLESILVRQPTIVVGLDVVQESNPELVMRLRQQSIDVYLADPRTLEDVYEMTQIIADRIGAPSTARQLISQLQNRVADNSVTPRSHKRVFVYDCCDPPFTAGGRTVLTDIIERAGGHNIFAELDADWTHVSWEEIVSREHEFIVIHTYQHDGQGDVADKHSALRRIPSLGSLPTTTLPLGYSLGGLRSADAIERLRFALRDLP